MTAYASFIKQDIAGYLGVHRNTVKIKDGKALVKNNIVFEIDVVLKNDNMKRDTDNFKHE